MKWRKEPPDVPGWWWMRRREPNNQYADICGYVTAVQQIKMDANGVLCFDTTLGLRPVSHHMTPWREYAGPIEEPQEDE